MSGHSQFDALARAARHPQLRRVEAAYAAFNIAEHATWLALMVYAYGRGGVREASVIAFVQLIPATLIAPFTAFAGERFSPRRALAVGYALQSAGFAGAAAFAAAGGMPLAVYGAALVGNCAGTVIRPVMGSILPLVTHTPRDLVAANVVNSLVEQLGRCLGPLFAGLLIAADRLTLAFALPAAGLGLAVVTVAGVRVERHATAAAIDASGVVAEVFAGFRALRREPVVRWLIGVISFAVLVLGALDIIYVSYARTVLNSYGDAGFLQAAFGVGALVGAAVGTGLVGGARIMPFLVGGTVLLTAPLVALDVVETRTGALLLFGVVGAGVALIRFVGSVALQRLAPFAVLTRIFGVLESLTMVCIAFGALAVAPLVDATSVEGATVVVAVVVLVGLVGCIIRLQQLGAGAAPPSATLFDRIVGDPLFAPLPVPTVERIAAAVVPREVLAGSTVVAEGQPGDEYFLIESGEVAVTIEGRPIRSMGPGESFGEIALLHDTLRTATVVAATPVGMLVLDREEFLQAVTGHPQSLAAADEVTARFLGNASA